MWLKLLPIDSFNYGDRHWPDGCLGNTVNSVILCHNSLNSLERERDGGGELGLEMPSYLPQ